MRPPTHRWWAGVAVTVALTACAQASAEPPSTEVAGASLERPEQVLSVFESTTSPFATEPTGPPVEPPATTTTVAPLPRPAGDKVVTATIGGVERQWTLVVPAGTVESQRLPLLILLHGVGGTGPGMQRFGFEKYAAAAGFMVAYPNAFGGSWNDGRPGMEPLAGTPVDDVAFLRELIARSAADGADATRVAIGGFSNGALMASRAACDITDQLDSVVLVAGSGPLDMAPRCKPSRPLPVMVVFGTADPVVPYEGGPVASHGGKARGQVAPVREVLDIWRKVNGCTNSEAQPIAGTSPAVVAVRGTGCGADVLHFKVTGGGHDWVTNPSFDTTTEAWRFVSTHMA